MRIAVLVALALGGCAGAAASRPSGPPPAADDLVTLVSLQQGDIACYVDVKRADGTRHTYHGDFDLCAGGAKDATRMVGAPVHLSIGRDRVQADSCQGDPDCTDSRVVDVVQAITPGG